MAISVADFLTYLDGAKSGNGGLMVLCPRRNEQRSLMRREHIPAALCRRPQRVCWRRERRAGRTTEVSYQALVVSQYGANAVRSEAVTV